MKAHTFSTIQAWQKHTGTPTTTLADLTHIERSHLSKILSRRRRCSYEKALRLSAVTGVSIEAIVRWMAAKRVER